MPEIQLHYKEMAWRTVTVKPVSFVEKDELEQLLRMSVDEYLLRFGINRRRTIDGVVKYGISTKNGIMSSINWLRRKFGMKQKSLA